MASQRVSSVGTLFQRGDGESSEGFTSISEIDSITGPGLTRKFVRRTSLDSIGGWEEYGPGFRDGGNTTLEMGWTLAGFNAFLDDYQSDDAVNYQIVIPDTGSTTLGFAGFVTDMPLKIDRDGDIMMSVTIKVSGALTLET